MKFTINKYIHIREYKNGNKSHFHIINENTGEITQVDQAKKVLKILEKLTK